MKEGNSSDLIVNGMGNFSGGTYRNIEINGTGSIRGDVECEEFECSGMAKVTGNLKAGAMTADGMSKFDGNVECGKLRVDGTLGISHSLKADEVELDGMVNVKGDLTAESFKSSGSFTVGGLLNAETIDIGMEMRCQAGEIGGEDIKVHMDRAGIGMWGKPAGLTAGTIEGDNIYLEYTCAKVVRGGSVNIGPGCRIELAEYKDSFTKADDAVVKECKKIIS